MSETERLLRSSTEQWNTVRGLLRLGRVDARAAQMVSEEAQRCQDTIADQRKRTPIDSNSTAEAVHDLALVLDDLVSGDLTPA